MTLREGRSAQPSITDRAIRTDADNLLGWTGPIRYEVTPVIEDEKLGELLVQHGHGWVDEHTNGPRHRSPVTGLAVKDQWTSSNSTGSMHSGPSLVGSIT